MFTTPMDVMAGFPDRKTTELRQSFRDAVQSYCVELGYACSVETGSFGCKNLIIGSPDTAAFLVTAGYDASAVLTMLEIARTFSENQRGKVCFVLLDAVILAARSYRKIHEEATGRQLVVHLDNVCSGDQIRMLPSKKLREDRKKLTSLYKACGYFGRKSLLVEEKRGLGKKAVCCCFPYAVSICTIRKEKTGSDKKETPDQTNINILRAALTTFICCDAAQ